MSVKSLQVNHNQLLLMRFSYFKKYHIMRIIDRYEAPFLALLVLITFFVIDGYRPSYSENPELSTVVFYVD